LPWGRGKGSAHSFAFYLKSICNSGEFIYFLFVLLKRFSKKHLLALLKQGSPVPLKNGVHHVQLSSGEGMRVGIQAFGATLGRSSFWGV
jgi:hypothetical protein